jgi:hypothetical protein
MSEENEVQRSHDPEVTTLSGSNRVSKTRLAIAIVRDPGGRDERKRLTVRNDLVKYHSSDPV